MKKVFRLSLLLILLGMMGCATSSSEKSTEPIEPVDKATEVVERAIAWAGGMDKWNNLSTISYTKRSRLLLENGDVESDVTQLHAYQMAPNLSMEISWNSDDQTYRILHTDTASIRIKNDSVIAQGPKVKESAFSALYVLGMPFKLKDAGTQLAYEGRVDFNGQEADVIKATYQPDKHANHSTSDLWWYYFATSDGAFLGCKVYHPPTYALIENVMFQEVEGMQFQKRRMSYRCDSLGNKQFLRAEFWYEGFEVEFVGD